MGKVTKTAVAKKVTKPQLKAICDGSHCIDGGIYTFKTGDVITLSKKSHYESMKGLSCFNEV
ncbi:MAG: hypothetical protein HOE82_06190 [Gammaproteobacteria bacterium]|jgi:hypothetical protein|nr:hypothetical protein [Gammaproteobacteria bacterium]MBT6554036.1 hypothetical protein [Candidatus Neomarinimicrobiota bacterium]